MAEDSRQLKASGDFLKAFDFSAKLSLYIHIPFCSKKCGYCAFFSSVHGAETKRRYTEKLESEINAVTKHMTSPFYTVYLGGGDPGCLDVYCLEALCKAVCINGRPYEFTVEINPENLSFSHFPLFERYFTRLSMGVQSLDRRALEFLGRNAGYEETVRGLELSRRLCSETGAELSYDLITCLGSFHDPLEDARRLTENYPSGHLSVYALTPEEGTPMYARRSLLPDQDSQAEMLYALWEYLEGAGFEHYEVSNFCIDGKRSLHNSVYWNYGQYMGLGPAAASTAFRNDGTVRFEGQRSVDAYVNGADFLIYSGERLTRTEALEEFVIMGLRCKDGLDLDRAERDFGFRPKTVPQGFRLEENRLCPTDRGFMTADAAALLILE